MASLQPSARARAREKTLTPFAKVYSHRRGRVHVILNRCPKLKSGLMPTILPPKAHQADRAKHQELETYQEWQLRGKTIKIHSPKLEILNIGINHKSTAELHTLESLAPTYDSEEIISKLISNTFIHTIFAKQRWRKPLLKHQGLFPLGNRRQGHSELVSLIHVQNHGTDVCTPSPSRRSTSLGGSTAGNHYSNPR